MYATKYHPRGVTVDGYTVKKHPLYNTWVVLKQRCLNANSPAFKYYGARGIAICDRWLNSFAAFAEDMGMKPSPKHSLDRIDNDGPYSPENCRWATVSEQRFNRRVFANNPVGVTGVQPNRSGGFTSMVHIEGVRHYLGTFPTIEEACNARQDFLAKQAA